MYYSITFDYKNTWDDWRLIPTSPPMVSPPKVYTNFVEIPGRVEGPIDLSEALTDAPTYNNSEGEWEFICHPDYQGGIIERRVLFDEIRNHLHNKTRKIRFDEDPMHYYIGRFEVKEPKTGENGTTYSIKYYIRPTRYFGDGRIDPNYP